MNNDDIIEIIDDTDSTPSQQPSGEVIDLEQKVADIKYNPLEPETESIEIVDEIEPTKNKSGLALVIILFILLAAFIVFLPKITEIFGSLF